MEENKENYQYYFFFNSVSGSKIGDKLDPLDVQNILLQKILKKCRQIDFTLQDKNNRNNLIKIFFASIQNQKSREITLENIKNYTETKGEIVRIVIAGGDGTIMWIIECLIKKQVDIMKCIIIPLPLGTGNDFSNTLGWGVDPPDSMIEKNFHGLKILTNEWQNGTIVPFDIWDVSLKTKRNGKFEKIVKIKGQLVKQILKDQDFLNEKEIRKKMSNYFSLGVDARVGFGFDKKRSDSKHCNKIIYCWEGFKKMFLRTNTMNNVIQDIDSVPQSIPMKDYAEVHEINNKKPEQTYKKCLQIKGSPVNLLCLNINSYSGGVRNIWQNAKIDQQDLQPNRSTSFNDGMLEFLTFPSIMALANERFLGGNAQRFAQVEGPIQIKFRESFTQLTTYFQVDGEYFKVTNPDILQIKKCDELPGGKVQVLVRNI